MDTVRPATREYRADADVRKRPVVLAAGTLDPGTLGRSRAARAVLNVTIATLLAAGAVAAGGWSIMTAARGSTPSSERSPLWYPTPPRVDATGGPSPAEPRPSATPSRAGAVSPTPRPAGGSRQGGAGQAGRSAGAGATGRQRTASPAASTRGADDSDGRDRRGDDSNGRDRTGGDDGGRSGKKGSGSEDRGGHEDRSGTSGQDDRDDEPDD